MILPPALPLTLRRAIAPANALSLAAGLIALTVAAGAGLPAQAQPTSPDHAQAYHSAARLSVTGQGSAVAMPDLARITVGVSVQADTAAQAMTENAVRQKTVIEELKASGIEERDIQTSGLNLSAVQDYSREGKPPVITGYRAQNMVSLRVRDLSALGSILDNLVANGANEINGISFELEDSSSIEDSARINAVTSARHRAEVMASAAGQVLGPLVSLSDASPSFGPQPYGMARMSRAADAATPIQAGELSFEANVTAVYLLLSADQGSSTQNDTAPADQ